MARLPVGHPDRAGLDRAGLDHADRQGRLDRAGRLDRLDRADQIRPVLDRRHSLRRLWCALRLKQAFEDPLF